MYGVVVHKVNLVVALRNTWNDQLVTDSDFYFRLDGERITPVKKRFGHYVFVDVEKGEFELTIESRDFVGRSVCVKLKELEKLGYILELPMTPKYVRKLPLNCAGIYGKADPNTEVFAVKAAAKSQVKLEGVVGNLLKVKNPTKLNLQGATLAVWRQGAQPKFEEFFVLKKQSFEEFVIDRELKEAQEKGAPILKAYAGVTDEQGNYNVFVNCQNNAFEFIFKTVEAGAVAFSKATLAQRPQEAV